MKRSMAWKAKVFGKGSMKGHTDHAVEFAVKAKGYIDLNLKKIGNEAAETREMARFFFKLLEQKLRLQERVEPPTEDEVLEAIEQLKDVGRFSVFTTAIILPGGAISLMGLEILARKFGINFTFIPSSFRKNAEWKYPRGHKKPRQKYYRKGNRDITDVKPVDEV